MTLRPYQAAAVSRLRAEYRAGRRRIILAAPTGSGKTVVGCHLIAEAVRKGQRVLWLAHRIELIQQCSDRLTALGIEHGIIKAGIKPRDAAVQVGSVQTVTRRKIPDASLVFVDEAHHSRANTYRRILDAYPGLPIIGLTATPYRADGRGLGEVFESIVVVASPRELVEQGHLVAPRIFAPPAPDLSSVRTVAGDYHEGQLEAIMGQSEIVAEAVRTWEQRAAGQPTVVFAVTCAHSRTLAARYNAAGIPAAHLDGETPREDRAGILASLKAGDTRIICNVGVLTEGWDHPELAVCQIQRPTKSKGLYLQMVGRIMRPAPGKDAILLDHGDCVRRLGLPTDDVEFSLADRPKKQGEPPLKTCPECFAVWPIGTAVCGECGHEFEVSPREIRERDGELVEVVSPQRATQADKLAFWQEIEATRKARGYKSGWSSWRYKSRFGVWPTGVLTDEEKAERRREYWARRLAESAGGSS